jgi:hypothetical protein
MKISDLLTEDKKLDQALNEGPIARGIGKAVGGVAKGVGAVAGGVAGLGRAFKKGYQSGKDVVSGDDDDALAGSTGSAVQQPQSAAPTAQQINKAGPTGTAPAKQQTGVAAQAMKKTAQALAGQNAEKAGQTLYAQVKAQVNQLDKKGKQRILQLLQKSLQQTPAQPAAAQPAKAPKRGQPVKVAGAKTAPVAQPAVQNAGKIDNRPALSESFSLYRKK